MRGKLAAVLLMAALSLSAFPAAMAGPAPTRSGEQDVPSLTPPPGPLFPRPPIYDTHVYHHYPDLTTELQDLAQQYGSIAKLTSIGKSVQGRELWQMEITDFSYDNSNKLTVYVDGGHHGNEQLGMELAVQLIHEALGGRLSSPETLARYHFYIVPMINPDGNMVDQRTNANGVDLNRNYAFEWTDESNHGSGPESEPESHANAQNMRKIDSELGIDLYLSGHTGTNILIYSWAWTLDAAPDDALLYRIGSAANNLTGVAFGQTSHELYIATGSSKDFGYGELGAPSFTYEVDDSQNRQGTYTQTIAERLSVEIETCLFLIKNTEFYRADLRPARFSTGLRDDVGEVVVEVENRGWGEAVNATATLSFTRGGGRVITPSTTFSLGADNTTTLRFPVEVPGGSYNISLDLDYTELQGNNTTMNHTVFFATVYFEGSRFAAFTSGAPLLILGGVAAAAVLWLADRQTGGRVRLLLLGPLRTLRTYSRQRSP